MHLEYVNSYIRLLVSAIKGHRIANVKDFNCLVQLNCGGDMGLKIVSARPVLFY